MSSNTSTPPWYPTYNIYASTAQIRAIISKTLPNHRFIGARQLESGESFNNRIYFIEVADQNAVEEDIKAATRQLVLKVSGHFFGARKVQNEVGCLLLLRRYCPSVPAPRVIAWSETGQSICTVSGDVVSSSETTNAENTADFVVKNGWILMNRLPGRVLTTDDLNGVYGDAIIDEIASIVATWRAQIPCSDYIGNVRLTDSTDSDNTLGALHDKGPQFSVGGLVLRHNYQIRPLQSAAAYYAAMADDQVKALRTKEVLLPLRHKIETRVDDLAEKINSMIVLHDEREAGIFTHFDLAVRNILVSNETQPRITGFLDFEFAGYFPPEEEFINAQIRQESDWDTEHYIRFLHKLKRKGCELPFESNIDEMDTETPFLPTKRFEKLAVLADIIEHITPWYIHGGSLSQDALAVILKNEADAVMDGLRKLEE